MDVKFEGVSFNAALAASKSKEQFAAECKAEGKFKGDKQDQLIADAHKACKDAVAAEAKKAEAKK